MINHIEKINDALTLNGLTFVGVQILSNYKKMVVTPSIACFVSNAYGKRLLELLPLDCDLQNDKDFLECKDLYFKIAKVKKFERV